MNQSIAKAYIIYHEVAHALVALKKGICIDEISLNSDPPQTRVNTTSFKSRSRHDQITFYVAGDVSSDIYMELNHGKPKFLEIYKKFKKSGSNNDYNEIRKLLRLPFFIPIYFVKQTKAVKKAQQDAKEILEQNEELNNKLSSALLKKRTLSNNELIQIITSSITTPRTTT